MQTCKLCGEKAIARRLCVRHYNEASRNGTLAEHPKPTSAELFWEKVIKHPEGCWEWTGALTVKGYGSCRFDGKPQTAHRISYFLHHGEWPRHPMMVCHSCDNPPCTNPEHLFLGTNTDNIRDAMNKGRLIVNDTHWRTRLSVEAVREIRAAEKYYGYAQDLAKKFNCSAFHIHSIRAGRSRYRA